MLKYAKGENPDYMKEDKSEHLMKAREALMSFKQNLDKYIIEDFLLKSTAGSGGSAASFTEKKVEK